MQILKKSSLLIIFIVLIILSACPAIILHLYSYDTFCLMFLSLIGKTDKLVKFQNLYFPYSKFNLLRLIAFTIPPVTAFSLFFIYKTKHFSVVFFRSLYFSAKVKVRSYFDFINQLPLDEKLFLILFFGLVAFTRIYYLFKMPVSFDEALTYLYFIQNGFLVSLTSYSDPNNHILHSLMANISLYLPFNTTTNLRIPVLIVGLISVFLFWLLTAKFFSWKTAIIATAFFSSFYPAIYYGYVSRGYALTLFAFVIGGYCVCRIIAEKRTVRFWYLWSLSGIIGLYSIPVYFYPFVSTCLIIFIAAVYQKEFAKIKLLLINGTIVTISVIFLYLPIFIINSVSSVTSNQYIRPAISDLDMTTGLLPHFATTFNYFLSSKWGWLIIISLIVINYSFSEYKWLVNIIGGFILIPFLLLVIHHVIPASRVWFYQIASISLLIAITVSLIIKRIKFPKLLAMFLAIIILLLGILNFNQRVKPHQPLAFDAEVLATIVSQKELKSVYVNYDLMDVYSLYYFTINNKNYNLYRANFQGELENEKLNEFDLIIIKKGSRNDIKLEDYDVILENPDFAAYLRKP